MNYLHKTIQRKSYYKQPRQPRTRINHWIKTTPIRLIDENGQNIGIVETSQGLKMAQEKGLDLIEIAPTARPPVCKLMEYGKYQYQKSKEEKKQKSKQKQTETKGVRISLRIGQHDLVVRAKQAEKFLNQGHKVKIEIILKGREKALFEMAKEKLNKFIKLIPMETKIEQEIKRQPRGLSIIIGKSNNPNNSKNEKDENQKGLA